MRGNVDIRISCKRMWQVDKNDGQAGALQNEEAVELVLIVVYFMLGKC